MYGYATQRPQTKTNTPLKEAAMELEYVNAYYQFKLMAPLVGGGAAIATYLVVMSWRWLKTGKWEE